MNLYIVFLLLILFCCIVLSVLSLNAFEGPSTFLTLFNISLIVTPTVWAAYYYFAGKLLATFVGDSNYRRILLVSAFGAHAANTYRKLYTNCKTLEEDCVERNLCALLVVETVLTAVLSYVTYQWGLQ